MTALSLALVACVALVCATYLLNRYLDVRLAEAERPRTAMREVERLRSAFELWKDATGPLGQKVADLETKTESLRAHAAMRGM